MPFYGSPFTFGTLGVNDQLITVPPLSMFSPAPAIGPIARGQGYSNLSTLPGGVATPDVGVARGGSMQLSGWHVSVGLAIMFVVGILILEHVHWRG